MRDWSIEALVRYRRESVVREKRMIGKRNDNYLIAFCTACAMVGFALYEQYGGRVAVTSTGFFIAAAVICLLPVVYGLLRGKGYRGC